MPTQFFYSQNFIVDHNLQLYLDLREEEKIFSLSFLRCEDKSYT